MSRGWSSLLFISLFWWTAASSNPHTVRVLTYNIHHGEGMDGQFDLARLARIIENANPDLVALQEVDQGTQRASGVHELTELGRLTKMQAAFGKALDFQGGEYGVGILSRWPLRHIENRPLPVPPDREPRTALTVEVRIHKNGPPLFFTSTHLTEGRNFDGRMQQANELNRLLVRDDGALTILAGDLNSGKDTEVMNLLDGDWSNVSPVDLTPPDPSGRFGRVDYVLVRPLTGWRVVESTVIDAPIASDHRPVLVVLEWQGSAPSLASGR